MWNFLWSVNLWSLFPVPVRVGIGLLALGTVWWPAIGARSSRSDPGAVRRPDPGGAPKPAFPVGLLVAGLAAIAVWTLLRARALVFGDSLTLLHLVTDRKLFAPRSPLYAFLLTSLTGHGSARDITPGLGVAQNISIVAGLAFLGLLGWLWRRDFRRRGIETAAVLLGGYLCLFQGYVEVYGLAVAALTWYLIEISAPPSARNRVRILIAQVVLVLAHAFGLMLAPVTGWLLLGRRDRVKRGLILAGLAAAVATALIAIGDRLPRQVALLNPAEVARLAIGVLGGSFGNRPWTVDHGVISWMQAADVLNGLLLAASPAVLLLTALAATRTGRRAIGGELRTATGAAALLLLAGRILIRTPVGAVADWDLFAFLAFPLAFLALRVWSKPGFAAVRSRLAPALLAAAVVFITPWILTLRSNDAARQRFLNWVDGRPAPAPTVAARALVNVAESCLLEGDQATAAACYARAFDRAPVPFYARRAAMVWVRAGENARAELMLDRCLAQDSTDVLARTERGFLRLDRHDPAAAEEDFRAALRHDPRQPSALLGGAMTALERGNRDAGRRLLQQADRFMAQSDARRPGLEAMVRKLAALDAAGPTPRP